MVLGVQSFQAVADRVVGGGAAGGRATRGWRRSAARHSGREATANKWLWWEFADQSSQQRTVLIVLFAGALGALVHALRSFFWYVGNRNLKWSWVPMYLLLPLVGATLALVFYIILVAGLFAGAPGGGKIAGFAAIAALVGMFSRQASEKLEEIFNTIFTKPKEGKDPAKTTSEVTKVTVGGTSGAQTLSVVGSGFQEPLTVKLTGPPGAVATATPKNVTPNKFDADVTGTLTSGEWSLTVTSEDEKPSDPFKFTV